MKQLIFLCLALAGITACSSARSGLSKAERGEQYCARMDSVIRAGVYTFRPQAMQQQPAGKRQQITNINYRVAVYPDYIEVNLPFTSGIYPPYRRTRLNYTLSNVGEYRSELSADGRQWTITFADNLYSSTEYRFKFVVTPCTGDATLEISSSTSKTMVYYGFLGEIY